ASRGVSSGNPSANNLPPLLFHQVHGDNIRVSRDGRIAKRAESFCKGVTFSARPVKVAEKICVKFLEVSNNWSGVLRFGFTSNDPSTLRYGLPKYACPDLTNKPGYWAKALTERLCERDTVLFYYVTSAGDVYFGVNGEEKGVFFSGVDTRGQLWAMIDVYGNSTAIEFLDSRQQLNNSRRHIESQDGDRLISQAMVNLSIHPPCLPQVIETPAVIETPPPPRFQHPTVKFNPLPFHRTRGRNVRLSNDRCVASRNAMEFCQGYVFTGRPLELGERVVIQVLDTEPIYLGAMALGLTSCDPATLTPQDLPDDPDLLLDRPEYWVVSKDGTNYPQNGDELAFCITRAGEVQMSKNGASPVTLMHVDQSLTLWAFLDVYGSTQKIRILGSTMPHQSSGSSPPRSIAPAPSSSAATTATERCCPVTVTTTTGVGGGTVLVVNLPPVVQPPVQVSHAPSQPVPALRGAMEDPSHSATLVSNYSNTYIEVSFIFVAAVRKYGRV
ncbi:hypothetical protein AAG570_003164, partial [Ranatra chinensis]